MAENIEDVARMQDLIVAHKRAKQLASRLEKLAAANTARYEYLHGSARKIQQELARVLDGLASEAGLRGW